MRHKVSLFVSTGVLMALLTASAVHAQPNSTFKVNIFPLECSLDTIELGTSTLRQLTPDNCLPEEIQQPAEPLLPNQLSTPNVLGQPATGTQPSPEEAAPQELNNGLQENILLPKVAMPFLTSILFIMMILGVLVASLIIILGMIFVSTGLLKKLLRSKPKNSRKTR